jgi:hypothetical protein
VLFSNGALSADVRVPPEAMTAEFLLLVSDVPGDIDVTISTGTGPADWKEAHLMVRKH